MKNQTSLEQMIQYVSLTEQNSYSTVCSPDLKFQFVGNKFCQQMGYDSQEILNKNLLELDSPIRHLCNHYKKLNEKVLDSATANATREYFSIVPQGDTTLVIHHRAFPVIDIQSNQKIGLFIKANEVNAVKIITLIKHLDTLNDNKAVIINFSNNQNKVSLTEREEFILFLLALGKYDKEIAYLLHMATGVELTKDAITKIVTRSLFQKFNVVTRSELTLIAHEAGYTKKLPKLITNQNMLNIAAFI